MLARHNASRVYKSKVLQVIDIDQDCIVDKRLKTTCVHLIRIHYKDGTIKEHSMNPREIHDLLSYLKDSFIGFSGIHPEVSEIKN